MAKSIMTIVVCKPGSAPRKTTSDNTLEAMQSIVDGLIERVPLDDGVDLWLNEEGLLDGLTPNRIVTDSNGVEWPIVGQFFICGVGVETGESLSLTDRQATEWLARVDESPRWMAGLGLFISQSKIN